MTLNIGNLSANPYIISSNLTTTQISPVSPPVLTIGGTGSFATITSQQAIPLYNDWIASGKTQPVSLNQILGIPRGWKDNSNYQLYIAMAPTLSIVIGWDGLLNVTYETPFGTEVVETLDLSVTVYPTSFTSSNYVSILKDVTFIPRSDWNPAIQTGNLVFTQAPGGMSRLLTPDPRTTSWIASLQISIHHPPPTDTITYTAYQSNSPFSILQNTSIINGGPRQVTNYPDYIDSSGDTNSFAIPTATSAANISQLIEVPFGVNCIWVQMDGIIMSPLTPPLPIYYITFLQNGRWNK